jgi:dihydroorotase
MTERSFGSLADGPATLVIRGARLVDPATGRDETGDLVIDDGRIADPKSPPAGAEPVDGAGLVVTPAFCDLHVHLREPGDGAAETLVTGTRAAAAGGYTTVCTMPNTEPALDDPGTVRRLLERAAQAASRVRVIGAATRGRAGEEAADLEALREAGVVAWSDDGASVPDGPVLDAVLRATGRLRHPLVEHAEHRGAAPTAVMREGVTATRLGLTGWPPAAEETIVARDLARLEHVGGRLHLTHLSTAGAVELVRAAKARGLPVTCDVTPHHLACADTWVAGDRAWAWQPARHEPARAYDTSCRVNPPLPSRDDAAILRAALRDGTIDAIATDHAPHPSPAKLVPFAEAAPGLVGLETALSVGLAAVGAGELGLVDLLGALGHRPAAIIGERRSLAIGTPADLVAFDPGARWRVEPRRLVSRSKNTPFANMELPGVVRLTVCDGRVTYRG